MIECHEQVRAGINVTDRGNGTPLARQISAKPYLHWGGSKS